MLFSNGHHYGLYSDDWATKQWTTNLSSGQWVPNLELLQPHLRPLGQLIHINLAAALPEQELAVRLIWAAAHLSVVGLAAWFAYRLTRSLWILLLAGGALLFPLPAHEAIFWHTGAGNAAAGTLVALVSLHLLLSAVADGKKWWTYTLFGLVAVALIPQFYEQPAACVLTLPVLALVQRPFSYKRLQRASLTLLSAGVLLFLHWLLILRHSFSIASRGGLNLSIAHLVQGRVPAVLQGAAWLAFGRYGLSGYRSSWEIGMQTPLGGPLGVAALSALAACAVLCLGLALRQDSERPRDVRPVWILLVVGCVWLLGAFLPVLIIQDQIVESRLLYAPWVGAAFAFSAGLTLVWQKIKRGWHWVLGLALGAIFAAEVPTMAGFGQVYKLRYHEDQRQLAALAAVVPSLPSGDLVLLPLVENEELESLTPGENAIFEPTLLGVMEADYSAESAARLLYRKADISAVTRANWRPLSFEGIEGEGTEAKLLVNGRAIRADQLLALHYDHGQVMLHDGAIAEMPGGQPIRLELSLARRVAASGALFELLLLGARGDW